MNNLPEKPRSSTIDPISYVASLLSRLVYNLRLTWSLLWDGRVKFAYKLIPVGVLLYLVSPVDLIPEAAFGLIGVVDDAAIVGGGLTWFFSLCHRQSPQAYQEHVKRLRT